VCTSHTAAQLRQSCDHSGKVYTAIPGILFLIIPAQPNLALVFFQFSQTPSEREAFGTQNAFAHSSLLASRHISQAHIQRRQLFLEFS
jgi:hypothetical protein